MKKAKIKRLKRENKKFIYSLNSIQFNSDKFERKIFPFAKLAFIIQ